MQENGDVCLRKGKVKGSGERKIVFHDFQSVQLIGAVEGILHQPVVQQERVYRAGDGSVTGISAAAEMPCAVQGYFSHMDFLRKMYFNL